MSSAPEVLRPNGGLSVTELRTAIQQRLRHSGALRQLKTQLRGIVLTDLLQNRRMTEGRTAPAMSLEEFERCRKSVEDHLNPPASAHHHGPGEVPSAPSLPLPSTWPGRIADCLIHNHLIRSSRNMSIAIFAAEAEVPPLSDSGAPADEEEFLCQLMGLPAGSGVEEDDRPGGGTPSRPRFKSALHMLVEEALWRRGRQDDAMGHRHQCGTQTEDFDSPSDQTNPLTSMECRLAAVDAKYALTFSQMKQGGAAVTWRGEVERRMAQYKEDLHNLLRAEYQQKYRSFEQTSLHEARVQMEEHYKTLHEHHQEEVQEKARTLVVKSEQDRQRLQHLREDLELQRQRLEKKQLDMITFQQDLEGQMEKLNGHLREQRDKIQTLRFQCEKWEELCGSRLLEAESARAREMRRLEELRCAKADHAAEVHVLEEEIHQLRFRLRMVTQAGLVPEGDAAAPLPPVSGGVIPSFHLAPTHYGPLPVSASSAGEVPDGVESFIQRTDRSQREEVARQEMAATERRGVMTASSLAQGDVSGTPAGFPQATFSAHRHSPLSRAEEGGKTRSVRSSSEATRSPLDSSSFIARNPPSSSSPQRHTAAPPTAQNPESALPVTTPGSFPAQVLPSSNSTVREDEEPHSATTVAIDASTILPVQSVKNHSQQSDNEASFMDSHDPKKSVERSSSPSTHSESSKLSQKEKPTSPTPKATQRSGNTSSLIEQMAKLRKPLSPPNSSSTSSTSTSASSEEGSSKKETVKKQHHEAVERAQQALQAHVSRLSSSEAAERIVIDKEEETAFSGITWSARSRLSVLQSQQHTKAPSSSSSDDSSRQGGVSWMERNALARQEQRQHEEAISDDLENDDAILYSGSSSSESF